MERSADELLTHAKERYQLHDYHGAIHCLEEVVESGHAFADAYHLLGLCYSFIGQPDEALAQFDRALERNERYVEAQLHRAIVLNDLGRGEEARDAFRQVQSLATRPSDGFNPHVTGSLANQHAALGDAYAEAGALDRAIEQYQEAITLGPTFHDLRTRLARLLIEAGRFLEAKEHLDLVVCDRPHSAEATAAQGLACYLAGDGLDARRIWEQHLSRHPGDARVQGYLAMLERAGR